MQLVFATNNKNKVQEIQALLPESIKLLSLSDINCFEDIPETQNTIEGNASQKAFYIYNKFHKNCFADDTGLEVEALNGAPGVYSARYAGEQKNSADNMNKLLQEMKNYNNRNAQFKTVISLVISGKEMKFEGIVKGHILEDAKGNNGFGYDPIFAPHLPESNADNHPEKSTSFAEMSLAEKNKISHRAIAVKKLTEYLKSISSY